MNEALTAEEIERFTAHLRPLVDRNEGKEMSAFAYLWAVKPAPLITNFLTQHCSV